MKCCWFTKCFFPVPDIDCVAPNKPRFNCSNNKIANPKPTNDENTNNNSIKRYNVEINHLSSTNTQSFAFSRLITLTLTLSIVK